MTELPVTDTVLKLVLPATVRLLEAAGKATLPVKVAKPLLSMVIRSTSWPELTLELPVLLVLSTRLPPSLPVASCNSNRRPRLVSAQCCRPDA